MYMPAGVYYIEINYHCIIGTLLRCECSEADSDPFYIVSQEPAALFYFDYDAPIYESGSFRVDCVDCYARAYYNTFKFRLELAGLVESALEVPLGFNYVDVVRDAYALATGADVAVEAQAPE